jgi:hypothetical protein
MNPDTAVLLFICPKTSTTFTETPNNILRINNILRVNNIVKW